MGGEIPAGNVLLAAESDRAFEVHLWTKCWEDELYPTSPKSTSLSEAVPPSEPLNEMVVGVLLAAVSGSPQGTALSSPRRQRKHKAKALSLCLTGQRDSPGSAGVDLGGGELLAHEGGGD